MLILSCCLRLFFIFFLLLLGVWVFSFCWMFLRILGVLGVLRRLLFLSKFSIFSNVSFLLTFFLEKESNKENFFPLQILSLFCARCRLRRPPSHKAAAGQAAVGGWLGMTYNREFKEFREFREFAVDCTLSQAYIFAPA